MIELKDPDLAYLPLGLEDANEYIRAAKWAQEFAHLNRVLMLGAIVKGLDPVLIDRVEGEFEAQQVVH